MSKDIAKKVHALVESKFTYLHDDKQYMQAEHWTSHADKVLAGENFSDDCDKSDVSVIYCVTETGEDHLVCGVAVDGKTYILENRYDNPYDWKDKPKYDFKYFMKFDDPGQWFKVSN